jgi:ribosomal protein S18 acetylase RimI-like enzyme
VADSSERVQIEYGVYVPSDAEAMVKLLGEVFSRYDPPAVAAGLTASEFEAFVRLLCPQAADDSLTIVARLAGTGELIGALLTEDSASPLPDGIDRLSAKFDPIFDILGQLDTEYRSGRAVPPGESLHLFLLGVSDRVAGRGVAQQLVAACLEHGRRKGYRMAVTEATNKVSQHIFRKQGFVARVQRSYEAHRFDGRQVFASIAEHGGPILMDKSLAQ